SGNVTTFATERGVFASAPSVEKVAIAMTGGAVKPGYLVETWTQRGNLLHETLVDGQGKVLSDELRTNADSYNVFTDDPGQTPQGVVSGPGAGNTQSPAGWLAGSQTNVDIGGNNVHAYLDANADNAPDGGGAPVADGNFLTAANLGQQPST